MNIKMITDSSCELTENYIEDLNIEVVPITIHLGEEEFRDGIDIKPEELLAGMKEGNRYKTSQISPQTFKEVFKKHIAKYDTVIYIAFSSEISGTYQSAMIAKNELMEEVETPFDLEIIDSKCVSLGLGLVVIKAAEMITKGESKEKILEKVEYLSKNMEHIFTVDDLEYLYRGGRVSYTSAFVGGLLSIKPILNVDEGKLVPIEKIRGRKKAIKRMAEIVKERGVNLDEQTVGINHGNDLESVELLKEQLKELGVQHFIVNTVAAAIGAHSGPGTLSVFFLSTGENPE